MSVGVVGLGRMGAGITRRLRTSGHTVFGFDRDPALSEVASLVEMVGKLPSPKVVWVMVPSGDATEQTLLDVAALLVPGDVLIDGGNSYVKDTVRRSELLRTRGILFLDCGTSGGVWGFENGFCLMVGGDQAAFAATEPLFESLAPLHGYAYLGPSGAGHYAKMVHNGIEYGMLQAFAEGFDLMRAAPEYGYDLARVAALWNRGSVVRSWLLELAERAFANDPELAQLRGYVQDSGEGRWTVLEAVERGVNASVLAQALFARYTSREDDPFAMRVIAALRQEFGGHAVIPA